MKVRHFEARQVHGYLDFDIDFFPDITFLTGINGAGKTTVVNAISALISPSLAYLAELRFDVMSVMIESEHEICSISARRDATSLVLESSLDSESLTIPLLSADPLASARLAERESDYYSEQEARNASHPVLKRLQALPTPMFLGLERRSSLFTGDQRALHVTVAARRRQHNAFAPSTSRSLFEASSLAEQNFNSVQARLRDLTDDLKRKFILSALQYAVSGQSPNKFPAVEPMDVARVKQTLRQLGLTDEQVAHYLDPFVDRVRELAIYSPFEEDLAKVLNGKDQAKSKAYLEWYTNRAQFERLYRLLSDVDRFVGNSQRASAPLNSYLETVNNFLVDSHKQLFFDRTGNLTLRIRDGSVRPITALSSGESQIVVILTHLAFNPAARSANVFIVDEPELSLHLRWQELFVAAIRTLNPSLQVILATHSPAIILEDVEHCVDLSGMPVE